MPRLASRHTTMMIGDMRSARYVAPVERKPQMRSRRSACSVPGRTSSIPRSASPYTTNARGGVQDNYAAVFQHGEVRAAERTDKELPARAEAVAELVVAQGHCYAKLLVLHL